MATWPGKESVGPTLQDGKYRYYVKTTMPCRQKLQGTGFHTSIQQSYTDAHNVLDAHVRRHLDTCKKCPADTRRP